MFLLLMQILSGENAITQTQEQSSSSASDVHTRSPLPLTEANLALHNATPCTKEEEARVSRLQEAARQLGFDLPEKCFEEEKWDG